MTLHASCQKFELKSDGRKCSLKKIKNNLNDSGFFTLQKIIELLSKVGMDRSRCSYADLELIKRIYEEYPCKINYEILLLSAVDRKLANTDLGQIPFRFNAGE